MKRNRSRQLVLASGFALTCSPQQETAPATHSTPKASASNVAYQSASVSLSQHSGPAPSTSATASAVAPIAVAPPAALRAVELDPTGNFLALQWSETSNVSIWRFPELQPVVELPLATKGPNSVELHFSPRGGRFYVVESMSAGYEAHGLELWRTDTWERVLTPQSELMSTTGGEASPDFRHYLFSDVYTQVELYNLQTGERRLKHGFPGAGLPNRGVGLAISADSRHAVVIDNEGPVEIWNLDTATRRPLVTAQGGGGAAVFLPNNRQLAFAHANGSVQIMGLNGKLHKELSGPGPAIPAYEFPVDIRLAGNDKLLVTRAQCEARAFSLTGAPPETIVPAQSGPESLHCMASIAPDARSLVLTRATTDGYDLEIVDVESKAQRSTIDLNAGPLPILNFPDSAHVGVLGDGSYVYYDIVTGKRVSLVTPPLNDVSLTFEGASLVATRVSDGTRVAISLSPGEPANSADRKALALLLGNN